MKSEKGRNIVLKLGSRTIECGLEGDSKPLGVYNVHHFAEKQNFVAEQSLADHSHNLAEQEPTPKDQYTSNEINNNDIEHFNYLFHDDILAYNEYETFESDLKLHLRKLLTKIFYKCGLATINAKVLLLKNETLPNIYITVISDMLLNHFLMRAVVVVPTPLMACVASGSSAAIVVDIGWTFTTIDVVYDNRIIYNHSRFTTIAGKKLHYAIISKLVKNGFDVSTISFREIENSLTLLEKYDTSMDHYNSLVCGPYFISGKLFNDAVADTFFNDETLHYEDHEIPIVQLLVEVIKTLPIDLKKTLANKLILTGGITSLKGFKKAFIRRLLDSSDKKQDFQFIETIGAWQGASIFSGIMKHIKKNHNLCEFRK